MTKTNILNAIRFLGSSGDSFLDIENYEKYCFSTERIDCHHKREISEGKSAQQLIDEGLYYGVPASDLIFLTHSEHMSLHNKSENLSDKTLQKRSESMRGRTFSEEHKQKISESHKGMVFSDEHRRKLSESKSGKNHPFFGKHLSEEHKKTLSKALTGKFTGEKNGMFGKHHCEEVRQKIAEARRGKHWYTDGTTSVFVKECPPGFKPGRI